MSRRRKGRDVNGILVIDKPQGVTSNGILQQVKRLFGAAKAGHTGALDPWRPAFCRYASVRPPSSPR